MLRTYALPQTLIHRSLISHGCSAESNFYQLPSSAIGCLRSLGGMPCHLDMTEGAHLEL